MRESGDPGAMGFGDPVSLCSGRRTGDERGDEMTGLGDWSLGSKGLWFDGSVLADEKLPLLRMTRRRISPLETFSKDWLEALLGLGMPKLGASNPFDGSNGVTGVSEMANSGTKVDARLRWLTGVTGPNVVPSEDIRGRPRSVYMLDR